MKTIKKEYQLFIFDELDQKAKDKALNRYIEDNDYMFLSDYLNERLHELLQENKITDTNDTSKPGTKPTQVLYSLSYSQGDGCMFEGYFIWNHYNVDIKHSGHYNHENSKIITITDEEGNEITDNEPNEVFNTLYVKICKELEQYGYNEIEYQNSEEVFRETCEANEYTFLSDGTMFNE